MDANLTAKYQSYPADVRKKLLQLRALVLATAAEYSDIGPVTETLKWGELAFTSRIGSTLRMDCKASAPTQLALYFNCNSKLVATFREVFGDALTFEGNRAVLLPLVEELPVAILKQCIAVTLRYDRVKHKPLLGL